MDGYRSAATLSTRVVSKWRNGSATAPARMARSRYRQQETERWQPWPGDRGDSRGRRRRRAWPDAARTEGDAFVEWHRDLQRIVWRYLGGIERAGVAPTVAAHAVDTVSCIDEDRRKLRAL